MCIRDRMMTVTRVMAVAAWSFGIGCNQAEGGLQTQGVDMVEQFRLLVERRASSAPCAHLNVLVGGGSGGASVSALHIAVIGAKVVAPAYRDENP